MNDQASTVTGVLDGDLAARVEQGVGHRASHSSALVLVLDHPQDGGVLACVRMRDEELHLPQTQWRVRQPSSLQEVRIPVMLGLWLDEGQTRRQPLPP
jgi:hypothetical protein